MILAIAFGNPWMLTALLAGLIPIVLHLLRRRQYRDVEWAAMSFLLNATRRTSRRVRLEQLVLLTVRVLLLLLLAVALARPYTVSSGISDNRRRAHRVIVIDTSASMGAEVAGVSRFDAAREVVRSVIEAAQPGDSFQLFQICEITTPEVIRQPSVQPGKVLEELERLAVTDQQARVLRTLRLVADSLDDVGKDRSTEVLVLSDMQAGSWQPGLPTREREQQALLQSIAARAHLSILDVGADGLRNGAIVGFDLERPQAVTGEATGLQVQVRNNSAAVELQTRVQLLINGQRVGSERVRVPARSTETVSFEHTFSVAGTQRIECRIDDDALLADNSWLARVEVRDHVDVVLVNGREAIEPEGNSTFYLEQALDPSLTRDRRRRWIETSVISPQELTRRPLATTDLVFLCDISLLGTHDRDRLTQYVQNGGLLVIMPGDQARIESYNQLLHQLRPPLLPGRITGREGSWRQPRTLFRFETGDLRHAVLDPYRGNPGLGLERPLTLEYFRVEPDDSPSVETVLRFDSGDPAIVERRLGAGAVVLLTTPWDDSRWNTLARRDGDVLVALAHQFVRYALTLQKGQSALRVGQRLDILLGRQTADSASLELPDGARVSPTTDRGSGESRISVELPQRGWYRLESGLEVASNGPWAANLDPAEGRLDRIDFERFEADQLPGANANLLADWTTEVRPPDLAAEVSFSLARWCLFAALCLFLLEQLLSWRFRYGVTAAFLVLCAVLVAQPPLGSLWVSGAMAGVLCAALWWLDRHYLSRPVTDVTNG